MLLEPAMNVRSLAHLQASLVKIDDLIRAAAQRAQAAGHDPTDALRGLIISDDEVEKHLTHAGLPGLWPENSVPHPAQFTPVFDDSDVLLNHLAATFDLTSLDVAILLLCLAPELDRRYERLYAYLQDDVSQRRPTVNLMMNLLGETLEQRFAVWERLQAEQPLRFHRLISCAPDPARAQSGLLSYHLKVEPRLVAHLLGDTTPDERIKNAVRVEPYDAPACLADDILAPVRQYLPESPLVYMQGAHGTGRRQTAAGLCAEQGLLLLSADLARLATLDISFDLAWRFAFREAYLLDAALLLDNWERCLGEDQRPPDDLWQAVLAFPRPVFICGAENWEPIDIGRTRRMLRLQFQVPSYADRRQAWVEFTQFHGVQVPPEGFAELASKFRFTRTQIARAVSTAADLAASRGDSGRLEDLYAGAQAHSGLRLGQLARRIIPRYDWEDLILPPDKIEQLQEITNRARFAHRVHEEWGYGRKIAPVAGVSALFAGESGTGKTMSAEVIARALGLVMYKIDLSAVVSKYIGETEKNLSIIFDEAQASNAILFFDEADALFGKRSEVKDARDRYANIEIAYLLQKIESYDGVAIMATNLRQNLDEAFTRRLDFLVDFPFPDSEYRAKIWAAHFPPEAPLSPDVDLAKVGAAYRLAGGNIRNAAIAAAYLAAADGGVITLQHIRSAVRREHQKMGRLLDIQ